MESLAQVNKKALETTDDILNQDGMTLEEKLKAINDAMQTATVNYNKSHPEAPIDPQDALQCSSCQ